MANTRVQGAYTAATGTTRAFPSNVVAGNLLVARIVWQGTAGITLNSVTDSQGNTWTIHASTLIYSSALTQYSQIASCTAGSSAANTVTVGLSSGSTKAIAVDEYNSGAGTLVFDVGTASVGNSLTVNSGNVTTTTSNQLGVGQYAAKRSVGLAYNTLTGGFTEQNVYTAYWYTSDIQNLDLGTAGTVSSGATFSSGGATDFLCSIATFKVSGGGGGGGAPFGSVNVSGAWKTVSAIQVNVGGTWKSVSAAKVNVSGTWKVLA